MNAKATPLVALGDPYYRRGGALLYQGDCLPYLSLMNDASHRVPLCVTSPPYNIGKEYETPLSQEDYIQWCSQWMNAIYGVTEPSGAFYLNLGYQEVEGRGQCVPIPYLLWDKSPFYLIQELVWFYSAGVSTRKRFAPRNEKWLFYVKDMERYTFDLDAVRDPNVKYPNQRKKGKLKCNPLGKNPGDVWSIPKVTSGKGRSSSERTPHPAQFPLELIKRIIKVSSKRGDLILDPFAGSGTTAVAALSLGRRFLGFEVHAPYCQIAAERLDNALSLRDLDSNESPLERSLPQHTLPCGFSSLFEDSDAG